MTFKLSATDKAKMKGLHPDLVKVIERLVLITSAPFKIVDGVRSLATQRKHVANGVSQTLRSRHLTGHAVDIVPVVNGQPTYAWPPYYVLANFVKQAARDVKVPLEWGGDWKSFKDGAHWQLPWKKYPESASFNVPDKPITNVTEGAVMAQKQVLAATAGGTGTVATMPTEDVLGALQGQQGGLSSGDYIQLAVSLGILALTLVILYYNYRTYRMQYNDGDSVH